MLMKKATTKGYNFLLIFIFIIFWERIVIDRYNIISFLNSTLQGLADEDSTLTKYHDIYIKDTEILIRMC